MLRNKYDGGVFSEEFGGNCIHRSLRSKILFRRLKSIGMSKGVTGITI